jgi:hypothetical protein
MFHIARRRTRPAGVRFCDGCAEVTTAEQRARRRYERTVAEAHAWSRTF